MCEWNTNEIELRRENDIIERTRQPVCGAFNEQNIYDANVKMLKSSNSSSSKREDEKKSLIVAKHLWESSFL